MEKLAKRISPNGSSGKGRLSSPESLQKKFEEIKGFTSETIVEWFASKTGRGEFVVIINADTSKKEQSLDENTLKWLKHLSPCFQQAS